MPIGYRDLNKERSRLKPMSTLVQNHVGSNSSGTAIGPCPDLTGPCWFFGTREGKGPRGDRPRRLRGSVGVVHLVRTLTLR